MSSSISIIGFGPQAQIQVQILKKQAWDVRICLRKNSSSRALAQDLGFQVLSPEDLGGESYVYFLIPDQEQASFYQQYLHHQLGQGTCLVFAHGFAVYYQSIDPRLDLDIGLCVLKGTADMVKHDSQNLHAVLAVHQDHSGQTKTKLQNLAQALKIDQDRQIWSSFREETLANLFAEQYARGLCCHVLDSCEKVLQSYGIQDSLARLESWDLSAKILSLMAQSTDRQSFVQSMSPLARMGVSMAKSWFPDLQSHMAQHLKSIDQPDFIQSIEKSLKKN